MRDSLNIEQLTKAQFAREHLNKLTIQILTQAPANETNPELWLKQLLDL